MDVYATVESSWKQNYGALESDRPHEARRRWCSRPAVFIGHLRLIALPITKENIQLVWKMPFSSLTF